MSGLRITTGGSVTKLSNAGPTVLTSIKGSGTIASPTVIALDAAGNVYVASSGSGKSVKMTHAGAVATGSPFTDNALQAGSSIVVNPAGNVWIPGNTTGNAVAGAVAGASPLSTAVVTLGGSAADAASVWVANRGSAGGLLQFQASASSPLSPASGLVR